LDVTNPWLDYPAYELYTDTLRKGVFEDGGRQLRLVVGKDRRVQVVEII
jgi:D-glycerate 3-kinase